MTTLAYCAVAEDGQGAPGEILVRDEAVPGLARFAEAMHEAGAAASMQLGHAGPVAAGTGHQGLAPSRVFAPQALKFTRAATDADLTRITGDFAAAARRAVSAGFDAVELHFGHGYLVSAFLSPKLNRRTDAWGGSLENRARLARQIAKSVKDATGDQIAVLAKLNMADGVPGGLWLDESIEVARMLESDGALDAIVLTGGSSFENPMYLFRGEAPIAEMAETFPPKLRLGFKLAREAVLRHVSLRRGVLPAVCTAVPRRADHAARPPRWHQPARHRARRARQKDSSSCRWAERSCASPTSSRAGRRVTTDESLCIHCNKCMPTIYRGTHCVLVAPDDRPGSSGRR